jgi:hypothetical protein
VPPDGDRNEKKRQREREQYATMFGEKKSEINKKRHERYAMNSQGCVDLNSNMAADSTGMVLLLSVTLIAYGLVAECHFNHLCLNLHMGIQQMK